jgi:hypothetical protein
MPIAPKHHGALAAMLHIAVDDLPAH